MEATRKAISYTRFSSAGQADGDSERRQDDGADIYAAAHGLEIDESLRFKDHGRSGYTEENIHKGALGELLVLVRDSKIPRGTTLLIDNFDRLSRAVPLVALALFTELINAGLTIVTVHDEQKFNLEALEKNPYLLIGVFIEQIRAHSESKNKSRLVKQAWDNKKKQAKDTGKVMTRKTPYWISANADKTGFELNPERAEVLLWLISESEKGVGNNTLIGLLHEQKIPAWSKSKSWQPSYMQKTLKNPALFGAIKLNGEIVKGYYPPLIDEDRFYRLQALRSDRATTQSTSGRGKSLSNLFSGRLKCGYCGFSFNISGYKEHARKPGRKPYERKYMGCHGARIKDPQGCKKATIWFVDEFEPKILLWLTQLEVKALVGEDTSPLDNEKATLETLAGRLQETKRRIKNVTKAIASDDEPPKSLVGSLKALEVDEARLKEQVGEQQKRVNSLLSHQVSGKDRMTKLLKLFKLLKVTTDVVELKAVRQQLANLISGIVERVTLFPAGPVATGSKVDRYMTVTLKNGQILELDDSDDGDEAYSVDSQMLAEVLAG